MSRLRELYDNEITKKMTEKFGYKNPMMVPKIDKIVINMGVGEAKEKFKSFSMLQLRKWKQFQVRKQFLQEQRIQLLTSS